MPNDPSIPLQVRPPQLESPLQTVGSLMQLRQGMTRQMMEQAQTEEARARTEAVQAQAEQRQRDLADENTIQAAQKDPTIATAFGNGDFSGIAGKIQPKALNLLRTQHQEYVKAAATQAETDLKLNAEKHGRITDTLAGLRQLAESGDEGQQAAIAAYPEAIQGLIGDKVLNQGTFPTTIKSIEDLDALAAKNNVYAGVNAKAQALKKEQAQTAAEQAKAGKDIAETPGLKAKGEREQLITQAMKDAIADPTKGGSAIDVALPATVDAAANQGYKAAWQAAMAAGNPEAAAKVVEAAAAHATSLSPATRANKVATAAAEAQATAPIHAQAALNLEIQKAKLAPNGFGSIIEPAARGRAEAQFEAQTKGALTTLQEASRLESIVQSAQGGNKAAPGLVALSELKGFVNRVNRNELEAVGKGAGSLYDRVVGKINGLTEGQPIPPDILRDTTEIAKLQKRSAIQNYKLGVATLNAQHNTTVPPVDFDKILGNVSGGAITTTIRARDAAGKLHEAPPGTALPAGWKLEGQ